MCRWFIKFKVARELLAIYDISSIDDFRLIGYAPDEHRCSIGQFHITDQRKGYAASITACFAVNVQLRVQQLQVPGEIICKDQASCAHPDHKAAVPDIGQQRIPESGIS